MHLIFDLLNDFQFEVQTEENVQMNSNLIWEELITHIVRMLHFINKLQQEDRAVCVDEERNQLFKNQLEASSSCCCAHQ